MKKKRKVIMLPTEDRDVVNTILKIHSTKGTSNFKLSKPLAGGEWRRQVWYGAVPQHLYILSDEEIKEGDWCYFVKSKNFPKEHIDKVVNKAEVTLFNSDKYRSIVKKITATTDSSLYTSINDKYTEFQGDALLSQIPSDFIQEYVKAEGKIDEVELEYVHNWGNDVNGDYEYDELKLTPNNEVIISPISKGRELLNNTPNEIREAIKEYGDDLVKEKMYSRDDMYESFINGYVSVGGQPDEFDKWIEDKI